MTIDKKETENTSAQGRPGGATPPLGGGRAGLSLEQAQHQVDEWIRTVGVRYYSELTNLGILMEETGELARIMVRKYGDQSFKDSDKDKELADEMADVLWVLIALANQTGVNLTEALQKNFEKKTTRDADRHQQNEKLKPPPTPPKEGL